MSFKLDEVTGVDVEEISASNSCEHKTVHISCADYLDDLISEKPFKKKIDEEIDVFKNSLADEGWTFLENATQYQFSLESVPLTFGDRQMKKTIIIQMALIHFKRPKVAKQFQENVSDSVENA